MVLTILIAINVKQSGSIANIEQNNILCDRKTIFWPYKMEKVFLLFHNLKKNFKHEAKGTDTVIH